MRILESWLFLSAFLISCHIAFVDWVKREIPLVSFLMFGGISCYQAVQKGEWTYPFLIVLGLVALAASVIVLIKQRAVLGLGDWGVFALSSLWLTLEQISLFLCLVGVFGILSSYVYKCFGNRSYFPFAPSILFALFVTLMT
jgi:hypothetical protein